MGSELTQDELDDLLKGSDLDSSKQYVAKFTESIKDLNKSFSTSLTTFLSADTKLEQVSSDEFDLANLNSTVVGDENSIFVNFAFSSGAKGSIGFLFDKTSALAMASVMLGGDAGEIDENVLGAISEVASTFAGSVCTSFSNKYKVDLATEPGEPSIVGAENKINLSGEGFFVSETTLKINSNPNGSIRIVLNNEVVKKFIELDNQNSSKKKPAQKGETMSNANGNSEKMQQVQFSNFNGQGFQLETPKNINLLMDVYMEMTVELGRTKRLIKDILTMGEGTIIELDKIAGEPADILVNHKLVARGEVVVIDENFGIRVTEIISANDKFNPF